MDTNVQLSHLKTLKDDLRKVLPLRFELNEAFQQEQDLYIVLWDAEEERQFIIRPYTTCAEVMTRLMMCQREAGRIEGRQEVIGPIKKALGL